MKKTMRDKSQTAVTKTLVRNVEVPIPRVITSTSSKKNDNSKGLHKRNNCEQIAPHPSKDNVSLSEPALNTALHIVKEMKQTTDMKPMRVQNPPDFSEKVTQKINVPYHEHLYHDLVALSVSDIPLAENMCSVKVKPHKQDQSPNLAEFFTPCCISDIPVVVTSTFAPHTHGPEWDGRRAYLSSEKVKNDCFD